MLDFQYKYYQQTSSTNEIAHSLVEEKIDAPFVIHTDFQTAGRGQQGNHWESEKGKNLLFTLCLQPDFIHPAQQFLLSEIISVSIYRVLSRYSDGFCIKWPNDIYYKDKKIAGILIEHILCGAAIQHSFVGVGLNVNQQTFVSNAPNPVSLAQVLGCESDRKLLLNQLVSEFSIIYEQVSAGGQSWLHDFYFSHLYRRNGVFRWSDENGCFDASVHHVEADGRLVLLDKNNRLRTYWFKEVKYLLPDRQCF